MIRYPLTYNPILEYNAAIENGQVGVSKKVATVYRKLAQDVVNGCGDYAYKAKRANHAIEFIENYCRHSKGKAGGKPFILELWQKALVAAMFGFVHVIDGTRKYREVLLVVARKNGKSTLSAAIGLYLMVADGEPGAEIYAVATKKDQAKIIWQEARRMVCKSPVLHWTRKTPNGKIKPLVAEMVSDFNDSVYKPLGHDSDTQDGLNVHGGLLDEIHAWAPPMRALYDVIVDGVTAREQPMIFETTTAGTVREGLYDDLYQEAENVINGFYDDNGYKNEHFLPIIYELDSRKEWTDESCWAKANPGLGTIKSVEQLRAKVQKAIENPKLVKNLLCKDFNIPETIGEAWLTFEQLNNTATFDVRQLRPRYGIGGADFSSTTDLTAAVVIFMVPGDPHIYVLCMFWLPEELLERRVREDRIPYDLWKEQGYLRTCEGNKVRQKDVTEWFLEVQNELDCYIYCGGYDAWSASYWVDEMQDTFGKGVFVPVQQTMKTLSLPMKQLGADFDSKLIIYNNNPVLKWCLANTGIVEDKNGNIKPNKTSKARKRIDGLAALLDAFVVFQDRQDDYKTMI